MVSYLVFLKLLFFFFFCELLCSAYHWLGSTINQYGLKIVIYSLNKTCKENIEKYHRLKQFKEKVCRFSSFLFVGEGYLERYVLISRPRRFFSLVIRHSNRTKNHPSVPKKQCHFINKTVDI